ncbi:MAG: cation transporter, partial [Candidatus Acidiferrales bacterium]
TDLARRVQRLQVLTIVWMTAEAVIALVSAWTARSPALLGFGGDSAIELLSAMVVLWRFRSRTQPESIRAEKIAARITGALLFSVAAFVLITSSLAFLGHDQPRPSFVGIGLLIVAAFGMPWLAGHKRKLATELSSAALRADAAESSLCGYLSWIALIGLVTNALFGVRWADPVAAVALVPFIGTEGWRAFHASRPGCGCCSVEPTKAGVAANT